MASSCTLFVLTPYGLCDPVLAIAAARAGAVGILETGTAPTPETLDSALETLNRQAPDGSWGARLEADNGCLATTLAASPAWMVVPPALVPALTGFRQRGGRVAVEICEWDGEEAAALADHVDAWWLKGHEAGGAVGETSAFVLLQEAPRYTDKPVHVRGGIGEHTAAGAVAGGAAGVILDDQVLLLAESPLAAALQSRLAAFTGTETTLVENRSGRGYLRVQARPGDSALEALRADAARDGTLTTAHGARLGWGPGQVAPLGQAGALAAPWARRHGRLARALTAVRRAVREYPVQARAAGPLAPEPALAREHGTALPLVQGPMTHVSDKAAFLEAVAAEGALPMAAVSLMRGERLATLLDETAQRLGDRPWGVGLLGFVEPALRAEQMAAIRKARPPFALIAGGRPDQARDFEAEGIRTYLHLPSPALLESYLDQGARRFVIEGRECGGHIGPLSSFTLWQRVVDQMLALAPAEAGGISVLLAGGIHDALSATVAATVAAPLATLGVRVGFLMGTGYVFTREAVSTGAVIAPFQQVALDCARTVGLEGGPGYVSRCAETPVAVDFRSRRQALEDAGTDPDHVKTEMEAFSLGRLRLATKGVMREGPDGPMTERPEDEQLRDGMYMLGQVAALHRAPLTIADLHRAVTSAATARLKALSEEIPASPARPRPPPADIAIVGMAALLPGAEDLNGLWNAILEGTSQLREIPPDRWDVALYFDADKTARDKVYSRWGGFLEDVVFDPLRYGMPPSSVPSIDPMQLLALELARRALDDAGMPPGPEADFEHVSVILGFSGGLGELGLHYGARAELPHLLPEVPAEALARLPEWTEDSFAGLLPNVSAGRVANRLNLGGTNCTVDAACASSLAAVYQAVLELESGRSDMAVAGGVDTLQAPFGYFCFSKTLALSPTGVCRTFDAAADGIVISEGLGAVVLKRLADAERDGDRVYAVIKGVGASSDGRARGLTAPLPTGQRRALRRAYAQAGYSPATVSLFEAHGTGTVAGDRAELESVTGLLEEEGARPGHCLIGSLKTGFGHTKATAGVAGLMKAALGLHHRVLPPHRGVTTPNPALTRPDTALALSQVPRPWVRPADHARRAGVSAFGFGGTNFHVTLESYEGEYRPHFRAAGRATGWPAELFVFRAQDRAGLVASLTPLLTLLQEGVTPSLAGVARDLAERLPAQGSTTLAVVAGSPCELRDRLQAARDRLTDTTSTLPPGVCWTDQPLAEAGTVAVLFSGQGAQHPDMLREIAVLYPEMVDALDAAEEVLAATPTFAGPDRPGLARLIYPPDRFDDGAEQAARKALTATEVAQPALGAVGAGLWAVLHHRFGLQPAMAAGHSYGEYVALHAAGVLDRDTLFTLSEARGRLVAEAARDNDDPGTMAAVRADAPAVRAALGETQAVVCANLNSPTQTVISGPRAAMDAACTRLAEAGLDVTPVPVAAAFHSALMAPAAERLATQLAEAPLGPPAFPVFANLTAAPHDPETLRETLARHLTAPVDWAGTIARMHEEGARIFVEVGPRRILTNLTTAILGDRPHVAISTDGGGLRGHLEALGTLLAHGVPLNPARLFDGRWVTPLPVSRARVAAGPLPVTAWLVNGSYARPVGTPPRDPRPPQAAPALSSPSPFPPSSPSPTEKAFQSEETFMSTQPSGGSGAPPSGAASALLAWQETMRQFLRTQERVMTTYLGHAGGGAEIPVPDTGPVLDWETPVTDMVSQQPIAPPAAPAAPVETAPVEPAPAPAAPEPAPAPEVTPPAAPTVDPQQVLLDVVEERTGYPRDMLALDQKLEADLGIDSVKRVEILGAFQKALPEAMATALQAHQESLSGAETLGRILELVAEHAGTEAASAPFEPAGADKTDQPVCAVLPRYMMRAHAEPVDHVAPAPLAAPGRVVLTVDPQGVAPLLAQRLQAAGLTPVLLDPADDPATVLTGDDASPVRAVVHLVPLTTLPGGPLASAPDAWQDAIRHDLLMLYALLQAVADDLRDGGRLITACALGGHFGRDLRGQEADPVAAGVLGLVKALSFEWPECRGKTVDLDPAETAEHWAEHLWQELMLPGGRREVGYPGGVRTIFRTVPDTLLPQAPPRRQPDDQWVVLAVGGARGITAECLRDLAAAGATLILVGRGPLAEHEDPATAALPDAAALRQHLFNQARAAGEKPRPAEVGRTVAGLLRDREMRANMTDFRASGATVSYQPCDLRDETAVAALLDDIYDRYGRVDAVLYGAGIIEDRLLVDKDPDSVARVYGTKVEGARNLFRHLRPGSLQVVLLFTSVAGRYGNPGQTDYAAANETLNRMAWQLRATWGETVHVAALNWGPWLATRRGPGMVTDQTKAQFEARGVNLVPPEGGRFLVWHEILHGRPDQVELVAGDSPWEYDEAHHGALPLPAMAPARLGTEAGLLADGWLMETADTLPTLMRTFDLVTAPYLDHHRLDGTPVMPFCGVMEMLAEAAPLLLGAAAPGVVTALENVRWFRGLSVPPEGRLGRIQPLGPFADGRLPLSLFPDDDDQRAFYRGTVCFAAAVPHAPAAPALPDPRPDSRVLSMAEIYQRWLFHGPLFQTVDAIEHFSDRQIVARCHASQVGDLYPPARQGPGWVFDPALLDGCFQLACVWSRAVHGVTALPAYVQRLERFGADPLTGPLRVFMTLLGDPTDPNGAWDIQVIDTANRVRLRVHRLESNAAPALNRLGGGWAGGVVTP